MFDNRVTRYTPGLNSSTDQGIFSDLYLQDRMGKVHEYSNDFDQFVAADWVNTGAGTAALVAGDGGLLAITSAVSVFQSLQKTPANYQMTKNFRTWFRAQASLDSIVGNILAGLLNVTVTPFTGASQTDGAYFLSVVTTGVLTFNVAAGGVISSVNTGVVLVNAALANLAFYYDGAVYPSAPFGRVVWEVSGPGVSANARGAIAVPAAGTIAAFPGAVNLTPTLAVNAPTAVARLLTVDSLYVAKDRSNINATPAF